MKINPQKTQYVAFFLALMLLSALLSGCGHTYTQEEMVGVFKSDGSPTFTLHLNADGTSLTDYGEGGRFSGKWGRVSDDGIFTQYNDPSFNVNPTYYTIVSKDTLKPLLSEEAIRMGIHAPLFNRVK